MPKTAIHTKHTQEMSTEHLSILCELFLKSYFSPKLFNEILHGHLYQVKVLKVNLNFKAFAKICGKRYKCFKVFY
jgi:hypothetical protein